MKCALVIAFLFVSAHAAGVESPKSAKLQFTSGDAQVYTANTVNSVPVHQTVVAGNVPVSLAGVSGLNTAGLVNTPYYSAGVNRVSSWNNGVYQSPLVGGYGIQQTVGTYGVQPYGVDVYGKPVVNGQLPTGVVYEHHGTAHIGHSETAVHVKRPGGSATYYYDNPSTISYSPASWTHGMTRVVDGIPAQYLNGQWYYLNAQQAPVSLIPYSHSIYAGTPLYNTVLNSPAYSVQSWQSKSGVLSTPLVSQRPILQTPIISQAPTIVAQSPIRPVVQDKWYSKTNTQRVASPFYRPAQTATKLEVENDWASS